MLTVEQTDFYEQNGYLMVEDVITKDQLNKLQDITYDFIESSRQVTENDDVFDLDEGHSAETPRLTRIKLPHKQNKYFDDILKKSGGAYKIPFTLIESFFNKLNSFLSI